MQMPEEEAFSVVVKLMQVSDREKALGKMKES